jgi:heptosyltransferase I
VSVLLDVGEPRRIAVVMLSALGDAVHVLPVLNALKRRWPASRITWVIQPVPHQLALHHPAVDDFLVFHRRRGLRGGRAFLELREAARGRHFDLLLNLQVYFKAGIITSLLDAAIKLGFDRARARDLNWLFTTHRIPPHPVQHVQDQYFEFIRHVGVDPEPVAWNIAITPAERAAQAEYFGALERPACAVVLGTSRAQKNWPAERYARALEHVSERHGLQPVLVGGPSAAERATAAEVIRRARVPVLDALGDSVRRLVWLLDGSRLVISPDTGPLHVARALDRPLVGIYGYTNPLRHGPYRRPEAVVDGYARFPGERYAPSMEYRPDGMARVPVAAVTARIDEIMRASDPEPAG